MTFLAINVDWYLKMVNVSRLVIPYPVKERF